MKIRRNRDFNKAIKSNKECEFKHNLNFILSKNRNRKMKKNQFLLESVFAFRMKKKLLKMCYFT